MNEQIKERWHEATNELMIKLEIKGIDFSSTDIFFSVVIIMFYRLARFYLKNKCVHFPVLEKFFNNFDYTYKDIFKSYKKYERKDLLVIKLYLKNKYIKFRLKFSSNLYT